MGDHGLCSSCSDSGRHVSFEEETATPAKRKVQREAIGLARALLRARDNKHHIDARVLLVAGGAPRWEIDAVREAYPRAEIVAVDRDERCARLAREAGADVAVAQDLFAFEDGAWRPDYAEKHPPSRIREHGPFDFIHLDMMQRADEQLRAAVGIYARDALAAGGVLALTFSLGRHDVVEHLSAVARGGDYVGEMTPTTREQIDRGLSESLVGRIVFLHARRRNILLRSVATYRGPSQPMATVIWQRSDATSDVRWPAELDAPASFVFAPTVVEPPRLVCAPSELFVDVDDIDSRARLAALSVPERAPTMLIACVAAQLVRDGYANDLAYEAAKKAVG